MMTNDRIREILLASGFTVKEGQSDLKPYVYAAARALLADAAAEQKSNAKEVREIDVGEGNSLHLELREPSRSWWSLRSNEEHVRFLTEFEGSMIDAAIVAGASVAPADDAARAKLAEDVRHEVAILICGGAKIPIEQAYEMVDKVAANPRSALARLAGRGHEGRRRG